MIAACPKCSTRYRVENDRLRPEGVRLRCTRCQSVFRVKPPVDETAAPPPEPVVEAQPTPLPRPLDRERLVLLADPDLESAKANAAALAEWGLHPLLVHDGVEAILAIQRSLPRVVVLDAALPKMFGFQICELMKRNDQLREIKVVLVGAIHQRERYRRPPNELYGADAYIEMPELPSGLRAVLRGFGLPLGGVEEASAAPPVPPPAAVASFEPPAPPPIAPPPRPAPPPRSPLPPPAAPAQPAAPVVAAPAHAAVDPALAEEIAKAERLARIIVSDVVLYNEAKFIAAVQAGHVAQAMDADLEEGRALFRQRIDPRVREMRDFLGEELLRVARSRGMR